MDFITPKYSATDILEIAKIDHNTLQNWLNHGLLDRLGARFRPEWRRKYSLIDVLTIVAEAQLAFLGIAPKARNETKMAENIAARCQALIIKIPLNPALTFESSYNLGATVTVDCRHLADEVLSQLHLKD